MDELVARIDLLINLPYERLLDECVTENQDAITDLNRAQLDKGLDSDGKSLGEYKFFDYKSRWEPVDLKQTGSFRDSFKATPFGKGFEIEASDPKTGKLLDKYGEAVLGIAESDNDEVAAILLPDLIEKINAEL